MTRTPAETIPARVGKFGAIRFGGMFMLLFALAFCSIGAIQLYETKAFLDGGTKVRAVVLAVEVGTGDDTTTYRPTFGFTDQTGRPRIAQSFMSSSEYNFRPGSTVAIVHNFSRADTVRVDLPWALWLLGGVFSVIGAVTLIAAIFLLRMSRRPRVARAEGLREDIRHAARHADVTPPRRAGRHDKAGEARSTTVRRMR